MAGDNKKSGTLAKSDTQKVIDSAIPAKLREAMQAIEARTGKKIDWQKRSTTNHEGWVNGGHMVEGAVIAGVLERVAFFKTGEKGGKAKYGAAYSFKLTQDLPFNPEGGFEGGPYKEGDSVLFGERWAMKNAFRDLHPGAIVAVLITGMQKLDGNRSPMYLMDVFGADAPDMIDRPAGAPFVESFNDTLLREWDEIKSGKRAAIDADPWDE